MMTTPLSLLNTVRQMAVRFQWQLAAALCLVCLPVQALTKSAAAETARPQVDIAGVGERLLLPSPKLFVSRVEADRMRELAAQNEDARVALEGGIVRKAQGAFERIRTGKRELPRQQSTAHMKLSEDMKNVGLGYLFTGNEAYAQAVIDSLLEYAEFYKTLPYKSRARVDGRLSAQTLNEAMIFTQFAWAYDLVADRMSAEQRELIACDFLREGYRTVNRRDRGKSNWQSWHNAAMLCIGIVLGDKDYIDQAVNGPSGFAWQLDVALLEDGMWYEQSIAYHYFTMNALVLAAEAATRAGCDLYAWQTADGRSLKQLLEAPLFHSTSHLNQPAFADAQNYMRLLSAPVAWIYAAGYRTYGVPAFLWLWDETSLALGNRLDGVRIPLLFQLYYLSLREGEAVKRFSVGFGGEAPSGVRNVAGSSALLPTGMAVLRGTPGAPTAQSALNWKAQGLIAGHQQPNTLSLYWESPLHRWISPSGKWASYSSKMHREWVASSLSDNLLVVDRRNQYPRQSEKSAWTHDDPGKPSAGELVAFTASPVFGYVQAWTDKVYEGVRLERRLFHTAEYTLDVFQAASRQVHTYDWVLHISGAIETSNLQFEAVAEPLASAGGYGWLRKVQRALPEAGAHQWQTLWKEKGVTERLAVTALASTQDTDLLLAQSPWDRRERSTLIESRETKQTQFVNLWRSYLPSAGDPVVSVNWLDASSQQEPLAADNGSLRIILQDGRSDVLTWGGQPALHTVDGVTTHGSQALLRFGGASIAHWQAATLIEGDRLEGDGLSLRFSRPSNVSVQRLDAEGVAFLLIYDSPKAGWVNVVAKDGEALQWVALDEQGQPVGEPVAADGTWELLPYSRCVVFSGAVIPAQLPPLVEVF